MWHVDRNKRNQTAKGRFKWSSYDEDFYYDAGECSSDQNPFAETNVTSDQPATMVPYGGLLDCARCEALMLSVSLVVDHSCHVAGDRPHRSLMAAPPIDRIVVPSETTAGGCFAFAIGVALIEQAGLTTERLSWFVEQLKSKRHTSEVVHFEAAIATLLSREQATGGGQHPAKRAKLSVAEFPTVAGLKCFKTPAGRKVLRCQQGNGASLHIPMNLAGQQEKQSIFVADTELWNKYGSDCKQKMDKRTLVPAGEEVDMLFSDLLLMCDRDIMVLIVSRGSAGLTHARVVHIASHVVICDELKSTDAFAAADQLLRQRKKSGIDWQDGDFELALNIVGRALDVVTIISAVVFFA